MIISVLSEVCNMFEDVYKKMKLKRKILFNHESVSILELLSHLEMQNHKVQVLWALDCAKEALDSATFDHTYAQNCLDLCELWSMGKIKMPMARKSILQLHKFAATLSKDNEALCRAVAHGCATLHVITHAKGLIFYELTSIVFANEDDFEEKVLNKVKFYEAKLSYWISHQSDLREWASFF